MGGIAGLWNFDGEPVERHLLEHMAEPIKHRGPDGIGTWTQDAIGLVNFQDWTTPENVNETQPLVAENGNLCLTLHGRVDNREDLLALLDLRSNVSELVTDAELILRAYQRWGEECPQKILGEFAFAIWDGRRQQLFCARDIIGWKPFYYYRDASKFVWASEFPPFFRVGGVPKVPNEPFVADTLTYSMTDDDQTLYEGILRLPPAHTMVVTKDGVKTARYWGLDSIRDVHYKTDEDYAERFLELFQTGVRSQLRANGPLSASLSGGLDSSSVVCTAMPMLSDVQRQQFEVFSMSFPNTDFDETHYIRDVVEKYALTANLIDPRSSAIVQLSQQARDFQYFPNYPNSIIGEPLYRLAYEKGFRVMLSGCGGDEWFTGSAYHYADLLKNLQLLRLFREIRRDSQDSSVRIPEALKYYLLSCGVSPLVPYSLKRIVRRIRRKSVKIPDWINPQFAERVHLTKRTSKDVFAERRSHPFARTDIYRSASAFLNSHTYEMEERYAATFNIDLRNPFHFRPLVEFGLGIPEEQRRRQGVIKYVLRQAMRGILPESVRQRLTKAEFSPVMPPIMEILGGRSFFEMLKSEQRGWVMANALQVFYGEIASRWKHQERVFDASTWKMWMAMGVEIWVRECF